MTTLRCAVGFYSIHEDYQHSKSWIILKKQLKWTMTPVAPLLPKRRADPAFYKTYSPNKSHRNEQNPSIDEKGCTSNKFSLEFICSPSVQWIKNQLTAKVTQTFSRC